VAIRRLTWLTALIALGAGGCKSPGERPGATGEAASADDFVPPEIALPGVEEAKAFQREYDRELKEGTTTALTAVAAHYVAEGNTVGLDADGRAMGAGGDPLMAFALTGGRFACTRGCGDAELVIDHPMELSLGTKTLVASPQSGPGRVLVHDPNAPARRSFEGLPWFSANADAIVPAAVDTDHAGSSARLTTSRGLTKDLPIFGEFRFLLGGGPRSLIGYVSGHGPGHTIVLVPFTDTTTGDTTYPVGRYLTVEVPDGAKAVALDFNRATNPLCAYSEHFNCPIPPPGNRLNVAVDAGERYEEHGDGH
jgi:hypothetical protein